jgi:hypothetical protein
VLFFTPTEAVRRQPAGSVRVQFSRGLREASLAGKVTANYAGTANTPGANLALKVTCGAVNRASKSSSARQNRFARSWSAFWTVSWLTAGH